MHTRIKKLRNVLHLTQAEFADRIGVKRNTVATYEMGRSVPSESAISLICREFRVNEEWLRYGIGEMFLVDSSDEIENLAKKYDVIPEVQVFIEKLVHLNKKDQKVITDFVHEVGRAIDSPEDGVASPSHGESEADLHADLQREIDAQKKAEERSTGSDSTSA